LTEIVITDEQPSIQMTMLSDNLYKIYLIFAGPVQRIFPWSIWLDKLIGC